MMGSIDPEIKSLIADEGPISSAHYAILMENARKKQALTEYKEKYAAVLVENEKLRADDVVVRKEAYEITEFLRRELKKKIIKIQQMQEVIDEQAQEFSVFKAQAEHDAERQLGEQRSEYEAKILQLAEQLEKAQGLLNSMQMFKNEKDQILQDQSRLRKENEDLHNSHKEVLSVLERRYVEQQARQKKQTEAYVTELKRKAEDEFFDKMDKAVQMIYFENKTLTEELFTHVQASGQLYREKEELSHLLEDCRRELDIKGDIQEEQARRSSKYSRDIKEAREKVSNLECCINKITRSFEERQGEMLRSSSEAAADLKDDLLRAKHLAKVRGRELRRVRALAAQVLAQRTDVERFLIDSLAYVQRKRTQGESAAEEPVGKDQDTDGQGHDDDPDDNHGDGAGGGGEAAADAIASLSWAERERVLRILFAKINAVKGKSPPPPPPSGSQGAQGAAESEGSASAPVDPPAG